MRVLKKMLNVQRVAEKDLLSDVKKKLDYAIEDYLKYLKMLPLSLFIKRRIPKNVLAHTLVTIIKRNLYEALQRAVASNKSAATSYPNCRQGGEGDEEEKKFIEELTSIRDNLICKLCCKVKKRLLPALPVRLQEEKKIALLRRVYNLVVDYCAPQFSSFFVEEELDPKALAQML